MKVVALLTCHNRKPLTVACLASFFAQEFRGHPAELEAVVVDDGSTDGTSEAVRAAFGSVQVVSGDGTLFWAKGMEVAESHATPTRPEFLLWLNDDVTLDVTALDRLLATARTCPGSVVVGALVDAETR